MSTIIGVDLGTTMTCFGYFDKGQPRLIESETGKYLIPSVVTYTEDEILVGDYAFENGHKYPETSVYGMIQFEIKFSK